MGEAKRRKQELGALYGTPEGSNRLKPVVPSPPLPLGNVDCPPDHGVLVTCTLEESPCHGRTTWIDLLEVESADQVEDLIDQLTGRGDASYPDSWITEGTFAAVSTRGLGPHLSALASDTDGPWSETLADLADALQPLKPAERAAFLAWVEEGGSTHWLPGCETHYVEDVLKRFQLSLAGPQ